MANTILLKNSNIENKKPIVDDLQLGELAVNSYDGKVYTKVHTDNDEVLCVGTTERYISIKAVVKTSDIVDTDDLIGAIELPFKAKLSSVRCKTVSGTCTIEIFVNGVSLGTADANSTGISTNIDNGNINVLDDIVFKTTLSSGKGLDIILYLLERV